MLVVGLTGGIGSGKSTVARMFAELGVPVIDMDDIARELVAPGQPALQKIVEAFGAEVLDRSGQLDRRALRQRIFNDPAQRKQLEAILHPLIRAEVQRRIRQCQAPYCIVVIPLLIESGQRDLVDRILVNDAPETVQIERTRQRDRISEAEVRKILASQADRQARLAAANDVLDTNTNLENLKEKVNQLHQHYLQLAGHAA
jgi:dephospho-CoA kinase